MRIWDIHPGYLNRQSLLGEHRELHALWSILLNGKKGYARHPETLRWVGCEAGLARRHQALVAEMTLRGYRHHSPLPATPLSADWPPVFVDEPAVQFALLQRKYLTRAPGRLPLPNTVQVLWRQHKYSFLARDEAHYRVLGPRIAAGEVVFAELAVLLVQSLRRAPSPGGLCNALQHMWGHVAHCAGPMQGEPEGRTPGQLLAAIQNLAIAGNVTYLLESTALSDMAAWV